VTNYVNIEITSAALAAINYGGENLFAIHVIQTGGGAYMDLGVTASKLSHPIDYVPPVQPIEWKNIATPADWLNIKNDLSGHYRLTADIDLYNEVYTPIGATNAPFKGYIDGQNHTVVCPEYNAQGVDRVGLFGYAVGAQFVNLRFVEAAMYGGADVGVLVGRGKGITVEHVVFDDDGTQWKNQASGRDHVGIVAGYLESGALSTIKDVYVVNGIVESSEYQAGGLVGIMNDTRITDAYYTGTIAITYADYLTAKDRDASGIVSRSEGGKNYLKGVMSLATEIRSASGNEFISLNGGGFVEIDSATCFTRNDMALDPLADPNRGYARASASMKRPVDDFKHENFYRNAGWDMDNVWGIPKTGGFPIFRYIAPVSIPEIAKKGDNDVKAYSTGGNVVIETSQPASVWIYNLQGSLLERTNVNGSQTIALPRGIYIVKSVQNGNVKAVKILN
jgi:hypothetical protein